MAKERPLKENQLARLFLTAATLIALVVLVVALQLAVLLHYSFAVSFELVIQLVF